MKLPFERISEAYQVRRITDGDLPELLALAQGNAAYYTHMHETPELETLRGDLTKLPPRTTPEDKYFLGYYQEGRLCAALDLITRYPAPEMAFIGWFVIRKDLQGKGIGTSMAGELFALLKDCGYHAVRLGYVKGNEESRAFWVKQQFSPTGVETDGGAYKIVVMQKDL